MHNKIIRSSLGALLLAVALLTILSAVAKTQSVTHTDSVPSQLLNWTDSLSVPQFDSSLGLLTSVEVTLTSDISGLMGYENTSPNSTSFTVAVQAQIDLDLPDATTLTISDPVNVSGSVGPFDGTLDLNGPSAGSFPFAATYANQDVISTAAALQPFIGSGNITMPVGATGSFAVVGGPANALVSVNSQANASLTVRYNYERIGIDIEKSTNGADADDAFDGDVPIVVPGDVVTWTYIVTNLGTATYTATEVIVTDNIVGVTPTLDMSSDSGGDGVLSPGESWTYVATGIAANLRDPAVAANDYVVAGCDNNRPRGSYENVATVTVPGATDSDPSHYCNPAPTTYKPVKPPAPEKCPKPMMHKPRKGWR